VLAFAVHVPVAAWGRLTTPLVPVAAWLAVAVMSPNVRLVTGDDNRVSAAL
jgi:hypothetical protein